MKGQAFAEELKKSVTQSLKKSGSSGSGKFEGKISFKGPTSQIQQIEIEDEYTSKKKDS